MGAEVGWSCTLNDLATATWSSRSQNDAIEMRGPTATGTTHEGHVMK